MDTHIPGDLVRHPNQVYSAATVPFLWDIVEAVSYTHLTLPTIYSV